MRPGQTEPNELELAILDCFAKQNPSIRPLLTDLHVLSREYTGVGSFTQFQQDESRANTKDEKAVSLNALIHVPRVANGMGAVLFFKGSQAACLEIHAYTEPWDGAYDGFSINEAD